MISTLIGVNLNVMNLFKTLALEDSIEIKTSPEIVWEYFCNLENNYKKWHPEHVVFKWLGKPMESGSAWYAEEYAKGKLFKLKGTVGEVVLYRRIIFKYSFPISFVSRGFEWIIERGNSYSTFTAVSYMRAEGLMRLLAKYLERKDFDALLEATRSHVKEEGNNLKNTLEQ